MFDKPTQKSNMQYPKPYFVMHLCSGTLSVLAVYPHLLSLRQKEESRNLQGFLDASVDPPEVKQAMAASGSLLLQRMRRGFLMVQQRYFKCSVVFDSIQTDGIQVVWLSFFCAAK